MLLSYDEMGLASAAVASARRWWTEHGAGYVSCLQLSTARSYTSYQTLHGPSLSS